MNETAHPREKARGKLRPFLLLMALLLGPLALVFGFYGEEDLRGAWILSTTKAKWEAQGETFDPKAFIPPPIPDDQNLGALPIFKLSFDPKYGHMTPTMLIAALKVKNDTKDDFFHVPSLTGDKLVNFKTERDKVAALYHQRFPKGDCNNSVDQLDQLFPFWQTIIDASRTRSKCLFKIDYASIPFGKRDLIAVSGRFFYLAFLGFKHAALCLDANHADLALNDIRALIIIADGTNKDGSFINALVARVIIQEGLNITKIGISNHRWNDTELGLIQQLLFTVNELAITQRSCRAELASETIPIFAEYKNHPEEFDKFLNSAFLPLEDESPIVSKTFRYWPGGWWDIDLAEEMDLSVIQARTIFPNDHFVDVSKVKALERQCKSRQEGWRQWFVSSLLAPSPSIARLGSKAQTLLDEAIIACALERYHLAHNGYPPTLTELAPFCPKPLPHDVIGGKPYVYKLKPDGTFLLYSIGWNEVDDGGTPSTDQEQGDWVWPGHG